MKNVLLKKSELKESIVLGIPRGGVITADIVASKLASSLSNAAVVIDFDILMPRKLPIPNNSEVAIGAIMEDSSTYLDHTLVDQIQISQGYIEKQKSKQLEEIKRRLSLYRNTIELGERERKIKQHRTVILIDDGIATGATMIAAARWIRRNKQKSQEPRHLIIGATVAPKETVELLKREADHVEVITTPSSSNFMSVGQFYQNFEPVSDQQVVDIMRKRNLIS